MGGNSNKEPDSELITRIRTGDTDALRDVYLQYSAPLIGYIHSIIHDQQAAEDLLHDIFMKIWERRNDWQPSNSIAGYLYTAARNRAFDYHAHARVRSRVEVPDNDFNTSAVISNQDTDAQDLETCIRQALKILPENRRAALTLRVMHDMSYPDIATTLGVSETAARILVTRAREDLKGLLEGE